MGPKPFHQPLFEGSQEATHKEEKLPLIKFCYGPQRYYISNSSGNQRRLASTWPVAPGSHERNATLIVSSSGLNPRDNYVSRSSECLRGAV